MNPNEYANLVSKLGLFGTYASTGNGMSFMSGKVSYIFGLVGPSICLDTACSSSLVAGHLAKSSIISGESNMSVVAGANAIVLFENTLLLHGLGALSLDGRCKTFDQEADGYGRGEGFAVMVFHGSVNELKDMDGIVVGSGVNHDGRSSGLTVPYGPAQQALIGEAVYESGLASLDYISTHGTGTSLGDPIEMSAIGQVLKKMQLDSSVVGAGAIKTLFGHTESTAGLAGLLLSSVVLSRSVNPPMKIRNINPYVADCLKDWVHGSIAMQNLPEMVRVAGSSSFGMSGINAHMVSALHRETADGVLLEGRICGDKKLFWTNMSCLPTSNNQLKSCPSYLLSFLFLHDTILYIFL